MKRKRRNTCPSPLLDESPKRTKVHAQRKFAQGSNINSPVITPIRELESESSNVLPEPVELLPIKRPNTEDFLTFLCFRGTPILPPSLNFFNTASIVDTNGQVHEIKSESSQKNGPIDITKCGTSTDKPFIAFGVRKRADPIVISRQMDRKRRHALAIQALRRKYQEQKMAKIRALTISKLSEKVTNRTLVKTNTVSKTETVTKKTSQKTKVVATKHVEVTTQTLKTTMRPKMGQKMCLRSFRGCVVQKELPFIKRVGSVKNVVKKSANQKAQTKKHKEEISEGDEPKQQPISKKLKNTTVGTSSRITRSSQVDNKAEVRRKQFKKRILRLTTVKKTVVSQRKSRSIQAKKRLRTVSKAEKKVINEKVNAKKLLDGAKKYTKPAEKKDTSQGNKKSERNSSEHKEDNEDPIDIKKNFKKVTDYKKHCREIIEKDKKQVNKRVDVKKQVSKSTDLRKNPKNMVESKKSIRISNLTQKRERLNDNEIHQSTSEKKRRTKVFKEDEKITENDEKIQKKSLLLKKTRSQSEGHAKEFNKKIDVDSKCSRRDKCTAVFSETQKNIAMAGRQVKRKLSKAEISRNIEENNKPAGTSTKSKESAEDKSKLKKYVEEDFLTDEEGKNSPIICKEIYNFKSKKELITADEIKSVLKETQETAMKEENIIHENDDETEMDLKIADKDNSLPVKFEIESTSVVEKKINDDSYSEAKIRDKIQQSAPRKIMNFKEVVEAILQAKDSEESDIETKTTEITKNCWRNSIDNKMSKITEEKPTEHESLGKYTLKNKIKINGDLISSNVTNKIVMNPVDLGNEEYKRKSTKDEGQQSPESQIFKKFTSGKEKNMNEIKHQSKVINKKKNRIKSLRKESTEEIEELKNITDKMRKLDTKTTEPSIIEDIGGKCSIESKYEPNECSEKYLIPKDITDIQKPEMKSQHDLTTRKGETHESMNEPKSRINKIETDKFTATEVLNIKENIGKLDEEIDETAIQSNMSSKFQSQASSKKSKDTKISEAEVENIVKKNRNIENPEQNKPVNHVQDNTETKIETHTKRQNIKKLVSDETVRDIEKSNTETKNSDQLLISTKSKKEISRRDESISRKKVVFDNDQSMPKTSQRPSRKTKEAAAIYMELLSQKLVRESRIDDDNISIDSFPELPNVKKTEQRENELKKAQVKTTENTVYDDKDSSHETMDVDDIPDDIKLNDLKHRLQSTGMCQKKPLIPRRKAASKTKIDDQFSDSDDIDIKTLISRMSEEKNEDNDKGSRQKEEKVLPKRQARNFPHCYRTEDSSDESFHVEIRRQKNTSRSKTATRSITDDNLEKNTASVKPSSFKAKPYSSSSDESTTSDVNLQVLANKVKSKKFSKTKSIKKVDLDFSDSDEEPLSKLTGKSVEGSQKSVAPVERGKDESSKVSAARKSSPKLPEVGASKEAKPKRECAKIPQNYLPMFSSSDEDDIFHGFDKKVEKPKPTVIHPGHIHAPPLLDLLNEDLTRRFGKEKVNMSNEQIEQWLKDSALAGSSSRKENDDMLKFGEKIPNADKPAIKSENSTKSTSAKPDSSKPLIDRKLIFRKNKKEAAPNINAFSPENESSVYAFGEENEEIISTPFRRPSRRPSSTATSRSEDESSKCEDARHFRKPTSKQDLAKTAKDEADSTVEPEDNTFYIPQKPSKTCLSKFNNKTLLKISKSNEKLSESDDFKYKIPSSPSASSSSSMKLYKRQKPKLTPVFVSDFPKKTDLAGLVEAPVFHPTEQEFQDPLEYIERIRHKAEQFGVCRIVPPSTFKPECKVVDDMRFTAYNQYVHKMLHRWGPNFKELMAIKKYLETQNISLVHPPWIGGMEIDLPKLYQTVQTLGGLKEVIEKKKWPKVSELMKIPKSAQDRVTKLDDIYCKYLLPYDTLSIAEREKLFDEVETEWAKRESKSLMKLEQKSPTSADTTDDSDFEDDADECITKGRNMALNAFYRIARNTMSMYFRTTEPSAQEVEQEYWKYVTDRQNHICVNSGSIDSGSWGYGFAVAKNSPFAKHPWNLKVLTNNSASLLRSIAPLMAVTVPTVHVGMVFSACCWYRDPHGLPWIEYLHTGGNKIWYGVPDSAGDLFRSAMRHLAPNYCKDKELWLPSDTVMVPPALLVENGVSLCRTVQQPGQFVVVFPKAFTSALSTGYTVSESVYFAPAHWLKTSGELFDTLRASREPSMFSLDRLLIGIANDSRCTVDVLRQAAPYVQELCDREAERRRRLGDLGRIARERLPLPEDGKGKKKARKGEEGDYECDICRMSLFVSMIFDTVEGINYCLDHGIEMLEDKTSQLPNCKFMFTYDDEELAGLPNKIKMAIENKGQKKVANKYAGLPTLLTK